MNYLLDKKIRRQRFFKLLIFIPILLIFIYFRAGIFRGLSFLGHAVFKPVMIAGHGVGGTFSAAGSFFSSKRSLTLENEQLKSQIDSTAAQMANYNLLVDENNSLKEILGRKNDKSEMVLAGILAKPNQSPYDTLLIDIGNDKGIKPGDMVFALGNIPIGRIAEIYGYSSKVVLFSSPGEKTEAIVPLTPVDSAAVTPPPEAIPGITSTAPDQMTVPTETPPVVKKSGKNIFAEVVGRGGGNFEILLPRDLSLEKGAEVTLPGINSYVLATMESVISDPRDSFQRALLVSPVNIQELKFVQVEN